MADKDYNNEIWVPVNGFPSYEVSNLGRVRKGDDRLLKQSTGRGDYALVGLGLNGKSHTKRVNRLVCEAFQGPPPFADAHAAHNDGVKANNAAKNLRWATIKENAEDRTKHGTQLRGETSGKSKLTEALVREIRRSQESGEVWAQRLGLRRTTISAVRRRLTWAHVA